MFIQGYKNHDVNGLLTVLAYFVCFQEDKKT